jgi:hypothetical protein
MPNMLTACIANCEAWLVKAVNLDSVEVSALAAAGMLSGALSAAGADAACGDGNVSAVAAVCKPA